MSDYNTIVAVDTILKTLLWSVMQYDSEISGIITSEDRISLEPAFKLVKDTEPDNTYLSLALYRIAENGEMKNRPLEWKSANTLQYPPLSLNLFYLITPLTSSAENDHRLLGKTMQVLYDNAIIRGAALQVQAISPDIAELRVILNPISMEDITKLWSAYIRPYRLSVSYEVKVVYIDSQRETDAERVLRKKMVYQQANGM